MWKLKKEIMLVIAEKADLATIGAMMLTSRTMYELLCQYQHSIVMAKMRTHGSWLRLPPSGAILSSFDPEREVVEPYTWETEREVQMRLRRIKALFDTENGIKDAIDSHPSFAHLPKHQKGRLVKFLARAAMQTDGLADHMAHAMHVAKNTGDFPVSVEERILFGRKVHREQIEYINIRFTPTDLAFLATFTELAGMCYGATRSNYNGGPTSPTRIMAFKEAVLRQGTMALWAWLKPAGFLADGNEIDDDNLVISAAATAADDDDIEEDMDIDWEEMDIDWDNMGDLDALGDLDIAGTGETSRKHLQMKCTCLTMFIEGMVGDLVQEIHHYESGRGAYNEESMAREDLVLPGFNLKICESFMEQTGRPRKKVTRYMKRLVKSTISAE